MIELKTVQLTDKDENRISPYTPGSSVYFHSKNTNGEDVYVNLDTKIGGIDVGRVSGAEETALSEIEDKKEWGLNKIETEGESYQNDINALSGSVNTLEEIGFPLKSNVIITPEVGTVISTLDGLYTYKVTEFGETPVSGSTITILQSLNGTPVMSETTTNGEGSYSTHFGYGENVYSLVCQKGNKHISMDNSRYICMFGAYRETINGSVLNNDMKKILTNGSEFYANVTTTEDNQYIWIAVPESLTINKIMSDGFEVTLDALSPYSVEVNGALYNAYRSKQALLPNTWKLVIK